MIKELSKERLKEIQSSFCWSLFFYFYLNTCAVYVCEIGDKCCFISPLHSTHKVQGISGKYYGMDFILDLG